MGVFAVRTPTTLTGWYITRSRPVFPEPSCNGFAFPPIHCLLVEVLVAQTQGGHIKNLNNPPENTHTEARRKT